MTNLLKETKRLILTFNEIQRFFTKNMANDSLKLEMENCFQHLTHSYSSYSNIMQKDLNKYEYLSKHIENIFQFSYHKIERPMYDFIHENINNSNTLKDDNMHPRLLVFLAKYNIIFKFLNNVLKVEPDDLFLESNNSENWMLINHNLSDIVK